MLYLDILASPVTAGIVTVFTSLFILRYLKTLSRAPRVRASWYAPLFALCNGQGGDLLDDLHIAPVQRPLPLQHRQSPQGTAPPEHPGGQSAAVAAGMAQWQPYHLIGNGHGPQGGTDILNGLQ